MPMTGPDSRITAPNNTPKCTGATKRKAQSQLEEGETHQRSATSSKRHSNCTSDPNDPDGRTDPQECSSTPKESESSRANGRKRQAANQLDEERNPRIRMQESERAKNGQEKEDPDIKDQSEIAKNSSMREDTKSHTSRGCKRTVSGVQANSVEQESRESDMHAKANSTACQGAILEDSRDEGVQIIAQIGGTHEKNSRPSKSDKEEQREAGGKKAKDKAKATAILNKTRLTKERCQICNVTIKKAENGTRCPPGPKDLGFKPGAPACRDCVLHLQKCLRWYTEEQRKKYPTTPWSTPKA